MFIEQNCKYYPCHFEGQDCTFCYCPFYPCNNTEKGGKIYHGKNGIDVWDCSECNYIHKTVNLLKIKDKIKNI